MKPKKLLSVMLCSLAITPACVIGFTNNTDAVTLSDLNASDVFVKQQESDTCTLASNVMLLRRAAILRGDSNWRSITESACRSTLWVEGCGMRFSYNYNGISVNCGRIYGDSTEELKRLLDEHPEGIVAYDYDHPHAIMLTGYSNGVFYCSDPARCCGEGIIDARDSLISTSGVEAYWYVTSSLPSLDSSSSSYSSSSLVNTSSISSSVLALGDKVTINADTENVDGDVVYTYQYRQDSSSEWKTIGSAKTSSTSIRFMPKYSTGYEIKVIAYDSDGNTSEKTMDLAVSSELTNNSFIDDDEVSYGNNVTIFFDADGGSGKYKYEVDVKKPSTDDFIRLKNYASASSMSYRPWEIGSYTLKINAKDSSGNISSKQVSFNVYSSPLENHADIDKDYMTFGENVKFTLSSKGGAGGVKYEIQAIKPSGDSWITLRKNCTSSSHIYHPWEAGTYEFKVIATDKAGDTSEEYFTLYVDADYLENNTSIENSVLFYGDDLMINPSAVGGTASYKYELNILKPSQYDWVNLRKYNSCKGTIKYHPWERGVYSLCVNVKDSSGNVTSKYFTFNVV